MLKRSAILFSTVLALTSCSTIDIQNVETDKLTVDVQLTQTEQSSQLDVFLKRGLFAQPVSLAGTDAEVTLENGEVVPLIPSRKKGRYGVRVTGADRLDSLYLEAVGRVDFPQMTPLLLAGREQFEDQLFFRDDVLSVALQDTQADARYLVVTGYCGDNQYTSEQKISRNDNDLTLQLDRLINKLNQVAEADLNGIIPISLAIEERYTPFWPVPFRAQKLVSRDETQFSVDTSGFRFKAQISIEIVESVFFQLQNQEWPVKYCY